MNRQTEWKRSVGYFKRMAKDYKIEVNFSYQERCYQSTTPYLPHIIEYGNSEQEVLELICSSIITTEEYNGKRLIN